MSNLISLISPFNIYTIGVVLTAITLTIAAAYVLMHQENLSDTTITVFDAIYIIIVYSIFSWITIFLILFMYIFRNKK